MQRFAKMQIHYFAVVLGGLTFLLMKGLGTLFETPLLLVAMLDGSHRGLTTLIFGIVLWPLAVHFLPGMVTGRRAATRPTVHGVLLGVFVVIATLLFHFLTFLRFAAPSRPMTLSESFALWIKLTFAALSGALVSVLGAWVEGRIANRAAP